PLALHLAWGAMARLWGSANRLDTELAHHPTWAAVTERYNTGAATHPAGAPLGAVGSALTSDTYRHARDWLTGDEPLAALVEAFTRHSVRLARQVGLLDPDGPGSRTRPHPTRTIYGDGTVVRPLYRPTNRGRRDPDAAQHVRYDGPIWGNELVTIAVRGPEAHRRVLLAVGRVDQPGREADTAIELIRQVHAHAGDGIQAVVYDGAFRGVHHETLMSDLGLIVINKPHPAGRDDDTRTYRQLPLGTWTHTVGRRTCRHTLVTCGGTVHDSTLDDSGRPVLSPPLDRQQIRRYRRGRTNRWRFALGVLVPCPKQTFTAWISPHPQPGETGYGRPDQLRLLPESDPLFPLLYGLRNDSEAINAAYKATLIADRASALGWRRQLLDLLSWALLTNTYAWHRHHSGPHTTQTTAP
ncbi:hypothetical protein, partial [Rhabdothermincola sp.]|uniref:hypothetical protein n=1 Tax=Rhabdothermincola sp. TaxID=2820405 RepID=UPI002FE1A811